MESGSRLVHFNIWEGEHHCCLWWKHGCPRNHSRLCIVDPAQDTEINPGWVSQLPLPSPFLLSFQNQDIHLFIGSRLMSARITLSTFNSLPTPKCPQGFHMEISHPLHFFFFFLLSSESYKWRSHMLPLISQGALEDARLYGYSW